MVSSCLSRHPRRDVRCVHPLFPFFWQSSPGKSIRYEQVVWAHFASHRRQAMSWEQPAYHQGVRGGFLIKAVSPLWNNINHKYFRWHNLSKNRISPIVKSHPIDNTSQCSNAYTQWNDIDDDKKSAKFFECQCFCCIQMRQSAMQRLHRAIYSSNPIENTTQHHNKHHSLHHTWAMNEYYIQQRNSYNTTNYYVIEPMQWGEQLHRFTKM